MFRRNPLRVFLSYKHLEIPTGEDEYTQSVACLVVALRARGIHVFIDKDLFGGDDWKEVVRREMSRADVMLICFSKTAFELAGKQKPGLDDLSFRDEIGSGRGFCVSVDGFAPARVAELNSAYAGIQHEYLRPREGRPVLRQVQRVMDGLPVAGRIAPHSPPWRFGSCGCNPDLHFDATDLHRVFGALDRFRSRAEEGGRQIQPWVYPNWKVTARAVVIVLAALLSVTALEFLLNLYNTAIFWVPPAVVLAAGAILLFSCIRGCLLSRAAIILNPPGWNIAAPFAIALAIFAIAYLISLFL